VPWRSAVLFLVTVVIGLAAAILTFDTVVGPFTWVLRIAGTLAWLVFAGYLGYRDIIAKKGAGPGDIDHVPFDRWSWIHATAGAVFGIWFVPFIVVVVLTIGWEFFEKYVPGFGENETIWNRLVDILGAWVGWFLLAFLVYLLEGEGLPLITPSPDALIR
jgi:hypothetical protein